MQRRSFLAGAAALALTPAVPARADTVKVRIGVGGKPLLYYLPLTIAERKGFFKEEGVEAEINDFGGGARSLQALIGGSVDVVTGAYEHTLRMQAKGQDVRAVCELGRLPAIVIAVRKDLAGTVKAVADLKGRKVGVTAPGSSTALAFQYAMIKAGLKATDAPLIGIGGGAGAIAAMKKGEIDAVSHLENVKVEVFSELVVDFAKRWEAKVIVKGLRVISDFEWEFQMNQLNRTLAPDIETVYVMASPNVSFVSSSGVKEIAAFGGKVEELVPEAVARRFRELHPNGRPGAPVSPQE